MAIIKCPNKQYSGISASVMFVNGEGETDDVDLIEWFKSKGYTVSDGPKRGRPPKSTEQVEGVEAHVG